MQSGAVGGGGPWASRRRFAAPLCGGVDENEFHRTKESGRKGGKDLEG